MCSAGFTTIVYIRTDNPSDPEVRVYTQCRGMATLLGQCYHIFAGGIYEHSYGQPARWLACRMRHNRAAAKPTRVRTPGCRFVYVLARLRSLATAATTARAGHGARAVLAASALLGLAHRPRHRPGQLWIHRGACAWPEPPLADFCRDVLQPGAVPDQVRGHGELFE